MNILQNTQDTEECVNDTYLRAWNSIPPERPKTLAAYLGRITRNVALDRFKARKTAKRGGEIALLLDELEGCIPSASNVESEVDASILEKTIDRFLSALDKTDRVYFVRRYWYNDSIAEISRRFNAGQSKVKTNLFRTRNKLKQYLQKEGIEI
jgi:RNA polymerase sigma-70 factor (ECF subfamily)